MTYDDIVFDILNELSIDGKEVEGTNDDDTPSDEPSEDDTDTEDDDDTPSDEPPEDDDTPSDEPPEDDDTPSDEPPEDDDTPSDEPPEDDDDGINKDIKNIEQELFANLTSDQISIRNTELKNHFIEIYQTIGNVLTRINDIPKSEDNVSIIEFIIEKLIELRDMVDFNITKAYNTRTYIENNIMYQQILSTLNVIADILNRVPGINNIENFNTVNNNKDLLGEPIETSENRSRFGNVLNVSDMMTASDYQEENYSISYQSDFNDLL